VFLVRYFFSNYYETEEKKQYNFISKWTKFQILYYTFYHSLFINHICRTETRYKSNYALPNMLRGTFLTDNKYVFDTMPGYNLICRHSQTGSRSGVVMRISELIYITQLGMISLSISTENWSRQLEKLTDRKLNLRRSIYRVRNTNKITSLSCYRTILSELQYKDNKNK